MGGAGGAEWDTGMTVVSNPDSTTIQENKCACSDSCCLEGSQIVHMCEAPLRHRYGRSQEPGLRYLMERDEEQGQAGDSTACRIVTKGQVQWASACGHKKSVMSVCHGCEQRDARR